VNADGWEAGLLPTHLQTKYDKKESDMKAAVCYEFGKPLSVEEVEIDPPAKNEVKVRLAAVAICHSDIHVIRGEWGNVFFGDPPIVAGHEAAGIVDQVGEGVTNVKPGDPVVVSLLRSCGQCFYCVRDLPHLCEGKFALDDTRLRNAQGQPLRRGVRTAAFAEYVVVHQSQVVAVRPDMPLDRASLLSCGVLTGLGAATKTAKIEPGSSVVVIGVGGVGLSAIQGALLTGAYPIIAVDVLDPKLDAAKAFGATHTINSAQTDAVAAVKQLTGGRGADYVLVTVGVPAAHAQGLDMIRRRGTLVIVGMPGTSARLPVPIAMLILREQRIIGSDMGSARFVTDVPWLVELYMQGRLKLDELITARYPLEQINEAIEAVEQGKALRNVIVFP
jgi:S-(hydroxymethyl)glutathione dehydrogenase/alcohol dehydrogenase